MVWVEIVSLLSVIQYFIFGMLVGRARTRFNVPAPAMVGPPIFECYMRVHQNTLEVMVMFLPSMWIASKYWRGDVIAAIGFVYLVGRWMYYRGYVVDPAKRHVGFGVTVLPIFVLIVMAFVGMALAAK